MTQFVIYSPSVKLLAEIDATWELIQWCEERRRLSCSECKELVHKVSLLKSHWFNEPRSLATIIIFNILPSFGVNCL